MKVKRSIAEFYVVNEVNYDKTEKRISINFNAVEAWKEVITDVLMIFTSNHKYLVACDKETFEFNYFSWANALNKS